MKGATGFSKIWIWVFLVGFILFLLSSNSGGRSRWNPSERLLVEITAPFQKIITHTIITAEKFWMRYFHLVDVCQENIRLKSKIDALKMENNQYREQLTTHKRLQDLLQFRQTINRSVLAAQVIGRDPTGWFKSIVIDKGKRAGLSVNMPVVNACGVVGRIVSLSPNYAKVLLIIDQNSAVDCLIQRSRDRGMLKGWSSELCRLDYVGKSSDVMLEDVVVTSGLGGIFPKGLSVGQVANVTEAPGELFKQVEVSPAVDFSKLEEVLVILKESELSSRHIEER